jgi:hypothetical protein
MPEAMFLPFDGKDKSLKRFPLECNPSQYISLIYRVKRHDLLKPEFPEILKVLNNECNFRPLFEKITAQVEFGDSRTSCEDILRKCADD